MNYTIDRILSFLTILSLILLTIFTIGTIRGCSNDIDGTNTYEWWAW